MTSPVGRRIRFAAAVVAFAVLAGLALTFVPSHSPPDAQLSRRLAAAVSRSTGERIRLADLTDFEWDRAHVFGPYSTPGSIESELGFPWDGVASTGIDSYDGLALLVFVDDGRVVRHVVQSRRDGDLAPLAGLGPFTPETAEFVIRVEDQGEPWRVFRVASGNPDSEDHQR